MADDLARLLADLITDRQAATFAHSIGIFGEMDWMLWDTFGKTHKSVFMTYLGRQHLQLVLPSKVICNHGHSSIVT